MIRSAGNTFLTFDQLIGSIKEFSINDLLSERMQAYLVTNKLERDSLNEVARKMRQVDCTNQLIRTVLKMMRDYFEDKNG